MCLGEDLFTFDLLVDNLSTVNIFPRCPPVMKCLAAHHLQPTPASAAFHLSTMDKSTRLSYLQWQDKYFVEKPYQVFVPLPVGVPEESATNLTFDLGDEEVIRDIRSSSTEFTLTEHGFTTCWMEMSPHLFSEMEIINDYIPTTCELVKKAVNAETVIPFDWRVRHAITQRIFPIVYPNEPEQIRKSASPIKAELIDLEEHMIPLLPAVHVHIGNDGLLPPPTMSTAEHALRSNPGQCKTACQASRTGRAPSVRDW